ncbi:hypothetical protein ABEG17_08300 [Pedococcus sp. KACC 23699]|uniref:Uncharacterized protein n=1 Tax=Pedococcus sp. KACC 23699 TaxID=3149228 RepID=A0AAU7JY05_9MICO
MSQEISAQQRQLLRKRDAIAAQASEAAAHDLPTAPALSACQAELEELLEEQLPAHVWRRLFMRWVVQDVHRSHDRDHPQPKLCSLCAAQERRKSPLRSSA